MLSSVFECVVCNALGIVNEVFALYSKDPGYVKRSNEVDSNHTANVSLTSLSCFYAEKCEHFECNCF